MPVFNHVVTAAAAGQIREKALGRSWLREGRLVGHLEVWKGAKVVFEAIKLLVYRIDLKSLIGKLVKALLGHPEKKSTEKT